ATEDLRDEENLLLGLLERYPRAVDFIKALAACRRQRCVYLYNSGHLEAADELLGQYLPQLQGEVKARPDALALEHELAAGLAMHGHVLASLGRPDRAERAYRRAIRIAQDLVARAPQSSEPNHEQRL